MRHRFDTSLDIYRVGGTRKPGSNVIQPRKTKVLTCPCKLIKTDNSARLDSKPAVFILKKTIAVPKDAPILLGDEAELVGNNRRYLVIDIIPHRYWKEIKAECEVQGSGLP